MVILLCLTPDNFTCRERACELNPNSVFNHALQNKYRYSLLIFIYSAWPESYRYKFLQFYWLQERAVFFSTYQKLVLHFEQTVRFALQVSALTTAVQSVPGHHRKRGCVYVRKIESLRAFTGVSKHWVMNSNFLKPEQHQNV